LVTEGATGLARLGAAIAAIVRSSTGYHMIRRIKRRLQLRTRWRRLRRLTSALGMRSALAYRLHGWLGRDLASLHWIRPLRMLYPVGLRHGSSDFFVFEQIFVEQEYAPLYAMTDVGLVIDCGANVGYSAAAFLARFPDCHVVAIEPDAGNFAMLQRNVLPYGSRVTLRRAAVWSHMAPLVMSPDRYRDGREWSKQVRECQSDEHADFEGIDIASVLAASGYDRISLLKVDVEGAEAVIFRGDLRWLDRVDAIAIELHDDSLFGNGSQIFFEAIRDQDFVVSHSEELTICRRPGRSGRGS